MKVSPTGSPYLEAGQQIYKNDEFTYQDYFSNINGYLKSHLGHQYLADKTVAV